MKCFWKAHCVGDIEGGIALLKLAKLYEHINDVEQAAAAYSQVRYYFDKFLAFKNFIFTFLIYMCIVQCTTILMFRRCYSVNKHLNLTTNGNNIFSFYLK